MSKPTRYRVLEPQVPTAEEYAEHGDSVAYRVVGEHEAATPEGAVRAAAEAGQLGAVRGSKRVMGVAVPVTNWHLREAMAETKTLWAVSKPDEGSGDEGGSEPDPEPEPDNDPDPQPDPAA